MNSPFTGEHVRLAIFTVILTERCPPAGTVRRKEEGVIHGAGPGWNIGSVRSGNGKFRGEFSQKFPNVPLGIVEIITRRNLAGFTWASRVSGEVTIHG